MSTLGGETQIRQEQLATRLLLSPAMRQQVQALTEAYRSDPAFPAAGDRAAAAAQSLAMTAALYAVSEDTVRPSLLWTSTDAHSWSGVQTPQSLFALDCPDNIYRFAVLDGAARYEIEGQFADPPPAQLSFVLYSALSGFPDGMRNGPFKELAALQTRDLQVDAHGRFTVTIDSDPADGRANHLQSHPDHSGMQLMVRDTLSDWARETPTQLTIRCLSGHPSPAARDEAALAGRAAAIHAAVAPHWRNWINNVVSAPPVNTVPKPKGRAGAWGFSAASHFELADDEALVITTAPTGAAYFGIQVADLWGIALDPIRRGGSFNSAQSHANPDGTWTYVIAPQDPGVWNWVDTGGLTRGVFMLRWQELPAAVTQIDEAVRDVRVVKLGALDPGLPRVSPDARHAQLEARAQSYWRRLTV